HVAAVGCRLRRRHPAPSGAALRIVRHVGHAGGAAAAPAGPRSVLARQRLLPHGRLVCLAALRLGVPEALCNRRWAAEPVPVGLPGIARVRWPDDTQRGPDMDGSSLARRSAPYLFLGQTTSLCETCLQLVPAKVVEENGGVYYLKRCPDHGVMKTLV